ncbi:MAG: hypothetical protein IPN64_13775 [Propionivibrio sp.]|uniref:hypothetical protein n=1 Tax=Propionivibrio sp. TaxID=2212460 RepID=UPI0025D9CCF9|nr:hypothetical protein [Propionivibrio sp.]MBK8895053.1 hypothetical protein [Propionivibrio sp.]
MRALAARAAAAADALGVDARASRCRGDDRARIGHAHRVSVAARSTLATKAQVERRVFAERADVKRGEVDRHGARAAALAAAATNALGEDAVRSRAKRLDRSGVGHADHAAAIAGAARAAEEQVDVQL